MVHVRSGRCTQFFQATGEPGTEMRHYGPTVRADFPSTRCTPNYVGQRLPQALAASYRHS